MRRGSYIAGRLGSRASHFGFGLMLSVAITATLRADCALPRYHVARDFSNASHSSVSARLVVEPQEITVHKLLCLAQSLEKKYVSARDVAVFIFGSRKAAELFEPTGMGLEAGDFRRDLRATFEMSNGRSALTVTPIGAAPPYFDVASNGAGLVGPAAYDTRFEFPLEGVPRCRHELGGRCLLSLEPIVFPQDALNAGISGDVIVSGVFRRDGSLKIDASRGMSPNDSLRQATLSNFATWRLEKSTQQTDVRLKYTYVIDRSLPNGRFEVELELPNGIRIRGNPARQ